MTLEELRSQKKALHMTNQDIADLSGLPLGTVQKVLAGITRSPRYDTMMRLEQVLKPKKKTYDVNVDRANVRLVHESAAAYGSAAVHESAAAHESAGAYGSAAAHGSAAAAAPGGKKEKTGQEGWYTYQDYIALPEDRRVELIDGKFYDMASPSAAHQIIIGQLHLQFTECVSKHPGCMVLLSPMDVLLDEDEYTVVQPDLMVFCDLKKLRKGRIFGAPDLVVEVTSPSSARRDYLLKAAKYMEAGVREYWIIDERRGKVLTYFNCPPAEEKKGDRKAADPFEDPYADQDNGPEIALYGMEDEIHVRISEGSCCIQMAPITKLLKSLEDA